MKMRDRNEKNSPRYEINFMAQVELEKKVSLNNLSFFLSVHLDFSLMPFTLLYGYKYGE